MGALLDRRYVVRSLLARGGMATVYRGTDTRLDRPVAIKVLHPQYAADRSWAERFEREARAAANLHHPNVVAVYDHGVDHIGDQAHPFLVMELIDGGTLRDLLDTRGVIDPALALSIIDPVLCALAVAHQSGLVHRDIKPENVLIGHGPGPRTGAGTVKVADFGLVRAIASSGTTSASVILGTVAYLSPEQVETGKATPQSDVYSTGLLLHEMLTGKPAFTGDTALSVAYQHVNSDVPAPRTSNPDIPAALDHLVVRATSRDQTQRPADAASLITELRQTRAELGLAPVPVPAVPPPDQGRYDPDLTIPAMKNPVAPTGRPATRALNQRPATQALHIDDDTDEPPPRRSGRRAVLWALAVLLLAGLAAGAAWLFIEADKVTVPNVAGSEQTRAEAMLRTAELAPDVKQERHNSVEAGTAIGTEPPAGSELRKGDTISLVISLGRPKVPDIAPGTSRADAEAAIKKVQLKPRHDAKSDDYHATIAKGAVITVKPKPGTPRKIGATVTFALSKGEPPTPVPDVTGKPKEQAFQQLRDAGFEPYEAGEEFNADIDKGKVTRTDPAAGASPTGKKPRIGVHTSNAVQVPEVQYQQLRQAERILAGLGLTAKTVEGGTFGRSVVVAQQPAPGTRVKPGSAVELRAFP